MNVKFKTDVNVINVIVNKLESGKLPEFTKEHIRAFYKMLELKDKFNMKDIIYDLQNVFGENSIKMRGTTRWAWYSLVKGSKKDPEVMEQIHLMIKEKEEFEIKKAAEKQQKLEEKAAVKQQQTQIQQEKEEMIDPVQEYCQTMGIEVSDINPAVLKKFPKPVKRGEEYKHSNIPEPREKKNCAIFLHNIKNFLKPGEVIRLSKNEKWKVTKGTNADLVSHLFVCYIYQYPATEFKSLQNGELEISHITKEDCENIIEQIMDDLREKGEPELAIIEKHIRDNSELPQQKTFEEQPIINIEPEVVKQQVKEVITLDSVKLYKVGKAVDEGNTEISSIENYIKNMFVMSVSLEDINTGLDILRNSGCICEDGTINDETGMKLLELIEKIQPNFKNNVTVCSLKKSSNLGFGEEVTITKLGTLLPNQVNIYNVVIDIENKEQVNALLRLYLKQDNLLGEKIILPPTLEENLRNKLNILKDILFENYFANLLNQVNMI